MPMHAAPDQPLLDAVSARLAALERELAHVRAAAATVASTVPAPTAPTAEPPALTVAGVDCAAAEAPEAARTSAPRQRRSTRSRRSLMSTAAKVAAATAGVGVLLAAVDVGRAHADGTESATEFTDNGSYAVYGHATTDAANGVLGQSPGNSGVRGISGAAHGVDGISTSGSGVVGTTSGVPQPPFTAGSGGGGSHLSAPPQRPHSGNITGAGAVGINVSEDPAGIGVWGLILNASGEPAAGIGVQGQSGGSGIGVKAISETGIALRATCSASNGVAIHAEGLLQVTGAAVGQATLAAHTSAVTVTTVAATPTSLILLTPLSDPGTRLWVSRAAGSFTIHASTPPASSVSLAYLVVN